MGKPRTYVDKGWYCGICDRETTQRIHESGHERDSSGDWQECLECGAYLSGYSNEWSPREKESKMKYNNEWLKKSDNRDFIFFWSNEASKPYSQWYNSFFTDGKLGYYTAEHYMMYHKAMTFGDESIAREILKNPDPRNAKKLGREVKGFDPIIWDDVKCDIVIKGNVLKFSLPLFKDTLLATGDKVIVEASPYDKIWGIGMADYDEGANDPEEWKGENLLGYAIMEARDIIRETK